MRIGIFLCDCGGALSKVIRFPDIEGALGGHPDVGCVHLGHRLCSEEDRERMVAQIKERGIDRVVIGACSPERYEGTFGKVLERAGVNRHLMDMANLREQCAWVCEDSEKATGKAKTLIHRALSRTRLLEPIEQRYIPVSGDVLVIGGGVAGMQATIDLSRLGLSVILIEREPELGRKLRQCSILHPSETAPEEVLTPRMEMIAGSPGVNVLTEAELTNLKGQVGNFRAEVRTKSERKTFTVGAVLVATGYETCFPSGIYGLTLSEGILPLSRFEERLRSEGELGSVPKRIGFMLDVSDEHCRSSAFSTLKYSLWAKRRWRSEVYIFSRHMKTEGAGMERLYRQARDSGVLFFKFGDKLPEISPNEGRITLSLEDPLLFGECIRIPCDLLVVDERAVPSEGSEVLRPVLDVGLGPGDFYQEDNINLYPVASNRKGIFFAGACHADLDLSEALSDAGAAASEIYRLLSEGEILVDVGKVTVDADKCALCLTCIRTCPHGAVEVDYEKQAAEIIDIACQGCCLCAAVCPAGAIQVKGYTDAQIWGELEALEEHL